MRIAIFSDVHDNIVNLRKFLNWCNGSGIDQLICCGDLTNSETLEVLADNFSGQIHLVKGNINLYDELETESYSNILYYGEMGRIEKHGKIIGFYHEPFHIKAMLKKGSCDIIFYGHTHKPWLSTAGITVRKGSAHSKKEKNSAVKVVNPGTLGGVFQKATFAVWDLKKDKLELKILETL